MIQKKARMTASTKRCDGHSRSLHSSANSILWVLRCLIHVSAHVTLIRRHNMLRVGGKRTVILLATDRKTYPNATLHSGHLFHFR